MASERAKKHRTSVRWSLRPNENYMLGHVSGGAQENRRLDTQHDAIRHGIMKDRLVHESIPLASLQGPVADICCGTGVWLNDLAKELAAADHWADRQSPLPPFVGFDLAPTAFRDDRAPNVQLVSHDCCQPFSSEFVGKFDLVNMRGLAYAIQEADFGKLFRNACSLLKPGGYIQWLETESQLWTSMSEVEELEKALDQVMRERSKQGLVRYMPDFMIQQYLSLSLMNPNPASERLDRGGLSLIHFDLAPGGASRLKAAHDVELNNHFSNIVLETIKLLLEGSLLKEQQASELGDSYDPRDIPTIKHCVEYVNHALATGVPTVSGHFPLLIASKIGAVIPANGDVA